MNTLINQEFLYRETPVNYDGTGTLTSIKGNTVSFNQLVQNGNFADTSNWTATGGTLSASGNVGTITNTVASNFGFLQNLNTTQSHKYYVKFNFKIDGNITGSKRIRTVFSNGGSGDEYRVYYTPNTWEEFNALIVTTNSWTKFYILTDYGVDYEIGTKINLKNVMIRDLTLMSIVNLTTTAEVEEWLSSHIGDLPYYDYTQGTLIPFMGTGLKTTGKNLFDGNWESGSIGSNGANVSSAENIRTLSAVSAFFFEEGETYIFSCEETRNEIWVNYYFKDNTFQRVRIGSNSASGTFTVPSGVAFIRFRMTATTNALNPKAQVEIGSTATAYEPYTSNTLSLPTSTYFPTGMKEAGSVYDELTESKVTTRLGRTVLDGTQTISFADYSHYRVGYEISDMEVGSTSSAFIDTNVISNYLPSASNNDTYADKEGIHRRINGSRQIIIGLGSSSGANTEALFNAYLSAHPLTVYYPLATPTETDISLDLTYPVWNGGTEQILPINDSTPDTAPILCDIDYRGLIPVNATVDPSGSGTVSGTGNYRYHSIATLEATPSDEIYRFLRWEDENGDTVSTNSVFSFEVGE
jgi:hypothetical protein